MDSKSLVSLLPIFLANFLFLIEVFRFKSEKGPFASALDTARHNLKAYSGMDNRHWTFGCFFEAFNKSNQNHLFHFILLQLVLSWFTIYSMNNAESWDKPTSYVLIALFLVVLFLYAGSYFQRYAYAWFFPKSRERPEKLRALFGRGAFLIFLTFILLKKGEELDQMLAPFVFWKWSNVDFDFAVILSPIIFGLIVLGPYLYNEIIRQKKHWLEQLDSNTQIEPAVDRAIDFSLRAGLPLSILCINEKENCDSEAHLKSELEGKVEKFSNAIRDENRASQPSYKVFAPNNEHKFWCVLIDGLGAKGSCKLAEYLLNYENQGTTYFDSVSIAIHLVHATSAKDMLNHCMVNLKYASKRSCKIAMSPSLRERNT